MIGKCDVCKRVVEVFEIMNVHGEDINCCDDCWNSEDKWETRKEDKTDLKEIDWEVKVGRPQIGETKKVSVTLPSEVWEIIKEENKNLSGYFRELVKSDFQQRKGEKNDL